jgi:hypothetical protein
MRLSLQPSRIPPQDVGPESLALSAWYDSQPIVRRLWGIRRTRTLRVILAVEATHDNSDVLPVWLSRCATWADELRRHTGAPVHLELLDELLLEGIELDPDGIVIADLYWRDATLNVPGEVP